MNPNDYYKRLIASITEDDVRRVAEVMVNHIGEENRITLQNLVALTKLNERTVRVILNTLVIEYGIPIGAFSGRAGRWICATQQELDMVISDLQSRVNETKARINALRLATIPAELDRVEKLETVAPTLFELPEPEQKQEWWRWKSGNVPTNYFAKG